MTRACTCAPTYAHEHEADGTVATNVILDAVFESLVDDCSVTGIQDYDGILLHAQGAGCVDPIPLPACLTSQLCVHLCVCVLCARAASQDMRWSGHKSLKPLDVSWCRHQVPRGLTFWLGAPCLGGHGAPRRLVPTQIDESCENPCLTPLPRWSMRVYSIDAPGHACIAQRQPRESVLGVFNDLVGIITSLARHDDVHCRQVCYAAPLASSRSNATQTQTHKHAH